MLINYCHDIQKLCRLLVAITLVLDWHFLNQTHSSLPCHIKDSFTNYESYELVGEGHTDVIGTVARAKLINGDFPFVQHRCVSIFIDRKTASVSPQPIGFALGSIEGRVAIQYVSPQNPKDNFTFKCHRSNGTSNAGGPQDIFPVRRNLFSKIIILGFVVSIKIHPCARLFCVL